MKVFIAGATGVLGRRLIGLFHEAGHSVVGLARDDRGAQIVRSLGGEPARADLFDAAELARAADGAEVVVHAATCIPVKTRPRLKDWELNDRIRREGTRALASCAAGIGARMLVQQSIVWVARPPDGSAFDEESPTHTDEITCSALDGEQIAREAGQRSGFATAVLRFGWFYSADAPHTRMFGEGLKNRRIPIVGTGSTVWNCIHVDDAAAAVVAASGAACGGLWHIVDDRPVSVAELLGKLARQVGGPPPRRIPPWLARLVAGRHAETFFTLSTRTSNARFRRDLGWTPRFPTYEEGFDEIVSAWKSESFLR